MRIASDLTLRRVGARVVVDAPIHGDLPALAAVPVRLLYLQPLSMRDGAVSIMTDKKQEVALLTSLTELDTASQQVAEAELATRFPAPLIERIATTWVKDGNRYVSCKTTAGERLFLIRDPEASISWLDGERSRAMIKDSAGNRYQLDTAILPPTSLNELQKIL